MVTFPEDMSEIHKINISMKTISLLMGEQIYQEGQVFDSIKYFGILPFPDLCLTGLTYFFLIHDKEARGQAKASTISILVDENHAAFLYENMKDLSIYFSETADKITHDNYLKDSKEFMVELLEKVDKFVSNVNSPISNARKLKLLFTGLDASGKTSYLRAIKQRYSELTGIKPTKGIERSQDQMLGQSLLEWDVGGQLKYRQNFLKQADLYLFDTNLLNFLIDIRDETRYVEALEFLFQILNIFRSFKQHPPIVVNFHKADPDIKEDHELTKKIELLKNRILENSKDFRVKFFNTSIFNAYSLNKSFSEGISLMSPNREILREQLKWFAQEINAQALLLINENSVILSDFSTNKVSSQVSEMSAPHFQNLFKTFSEFRLLKHNTATWQMDNDIITFYKLPLNNIDVYLLCLLRNQDTEINNINQLMPEFKNRINSLIETYL
ncbi:ADP-ribosylation factor-like protein [Candidatus Lokiarchaeum ossiferum]